MKCDKTRKYCPILMNFGAQTEKHMLSPKNTKAESAVIFQDGRCRHLGNHLNAIKRATAELVDEACNGAS
jgi:hypothetical protein